MPLSLRHLAGLLAAAAALPACQQTCPLGMAPPPSYMLAFSTDTTENSSAGFHRNELRSAYLVRYRTANFQQPLDTLRQPTPLTLNSNTPVLVVYYPTGHLPQFAVPDNGTPLADQSFRLVVPAVNRTYDISNIVLKQEPGANRCDGERLTRREALVNGQLREGLNTPPVLTK